MRPTSAVAVHRQFGPPAERSGSAMRGTLRTGKAVFDFMIQRQKADMPEDNPTVERGQAKSPFETVATVEIPAQDFESEARKRLAENISYSPWHGIRAHRPIGDINEARLEVYRASVRLRHERNGVQYAEPRLDT
jgi:hypothetical protein